MESNGEIMISTQHTKEDYINLNLSIDSDDDTWNRAIDILRSRIQGRYLEQIEILSGNICANSFTIMALNCLLVDALHQFKDGLRDSKNKSGEKYKNFLQDALSDTFDEQMANRFYSDVRCGILHSAQTGNKARLTDNNGYIVCIENDILLVSVRRFSQRLRDYFDDYTYRLSDRSEVLLRKNFIKKMDFICKRD